MHAQEFASAEGLSMNDERRLVRGPELARWLLVAALILIGIGLYVAFGPRSRPAAPPAAQEAP